ncbi:MAG TPA: ferrochelatase [Polyangiaceae bacterium]
MSARPDDGVLLLAHGTVSNLEEIPQFLDRIRHGRPASPELVAETRRRYALIGHSPLLDVTNEQARALEARLGIPVFVGMRLWEPSIAGAIERASLRGVRRLCVLPVAPYSVHVYFRAAQQAATGIPAAPELVPVPPYGTHPALVRAHADAILPSLQRAPAGSRLILTAHSLPTAALRAGDPYQEQVTASARAVSERIARNAELAFQSQGADGGDWLGPTLRAALEAARAAGNPGVVVAPFGFLAEHVETLYDLDHEARGWAEELALPFERVPALGTDAGLIDAFENLALAALV